MQKWQSIEMELSVFCSLEQKMACVKKIRITIAAGLIMALSNFAYSVRFIVWYRKNDEINIRFSFFASSRSSGTHRHNPSHCYDYYTRQQKYFRTTYKKLSKSSEIEFYNLR